MKNNLKVLRAMQNITQGDLAKALQVSRQTVSAVEKGKYSPSLKLGLKIAHFFKEPLEEIFWLEEGGGDEKDN